MAWVKRTERNRDTYDNVVRPAVIGRPIPTYRFACSRIPDQVRIPFSDGTTAIYLLKVEQPAPQVWRCEE